MTKFYKLRQFFTLCAAFLFLHTKVTAQTNNWAFLKGYATIAYYGVYGTKGTPGLSNMPGARNATASWELDGKFYFFGGWGYPMDPPIIPGFGINNERLNDLWRYDPVSGEWTWLTGSSSLAQAGVYGTVKVAAAGNTPGARQQATTWVLNGKLYLFGGEGYASTGSGKLNDLWSYDPATNQWTWLKGANTVKATGTYGTRGAAASANTPGARDRALGWAHNGKLYLFGGAMVDTYSIENYLNDLWSYDLATGNWTWLKGANATNQTATYGIQGSAAAANTPGATYSAAGWVNDGKFYMFSGVGYNASTRSYLSALWSYDPTTGNWTWVKGTNLVDQKGTYGTKGTPAANNNPGGRLGGATFAKNGKLYLFGGNGWAALAQGYLNDLWCFDLATKNWTWVGGSNTPDVLSNYGIKGEESNSSMPGSRHNAAAITYQDKLYLLDGRGYGKSTLDYLNELWSYNPETDNWTWLSGFDYIQPLGSYGTKGTPAADNNPGGRQTATKWEHNGKFYLFGGQGYGTGSSAGYLNDLWRYDPQTGQWVWLKGENVNNPIPLGTYGTIKVATDANTPGARIGAASWTSNGKLYLFGGQGYITTSSSGRLNDLWSYDPETNKWAWLKGSNVINPIGVYGTKGTPHANNTPGGRNGAVSWMYNGKLYLFGGLGQSSTTPGYLNDLWCYDPETGNWTWLKGSNAISSLGTYGTKGVANANNTPGTRFGATAWIAEGKLYLFGGMGHINSTTVNDFNDLWCYDPETNNWTWLNGSNTTQQDAVYSGGNTTPGSLSGADGQVLNGKLYLFGGQRVASYLSELWSYDIVHNQWTFIKGGANAVSVYDAVGNASDDNTIGGRKYSITWLSGSQLYVFGGYGYGLDKSTDIRGDLWKIALTSDDPLPIILLSFTAKAENNSTLLNWQTASEQNNKQFILSRSADGKNFTELTRIAGAGNSSNTKNYFYTDRSPLNGANYYKLEQIDGDGKVNLVGIEVVNFKLSVSAVTVYPNPTASEINLTIPTDFGKTIKVTMLDALGRTVYAEIIKKTEGQASYKLNNSKLPSGQYIIRLNSEQKTESLKLLVK